MMQKISILFGNNDWKVTIQSAPAGGEYLARQKENKISCIRNLSPLVDKHIIFLLFGTHDCQQFQRWRIRRQILFLRFFQL